MFAGLRAKRDIALQLCSNGAKVKEKMQNRVRKVTERGKGDKRKLNAADTFFVYLTRKFGFFNLNAPTFFKIQSVNLR